MYHDTLAKNQRQTEDCKGIKARTTSELRLKTLQAKRMRPTSSQCKRKQNCGPRCPFLVQTSLRSESEIKTI
jgi:hypothetical protein